MMTIETFPQRLSEHISVLGNRFFLLYLIQGSERSALFEVGVAPIASTILAQLEVLEIAPDYLIVSHPHTDHITALPLLSSRFPRAKVICGAKAQSFLAKQQSAQTFARADEHAVSFLQRQGVPVSSLKGASLANLQGAHVVGDEESLALGGITIQIKMVEGHAPGSLLAYIPEDDALLTSDSLGFPYSNNATFFPLFFTGFNNYINTIEKIAAFDASLLGLGHGFVATGERVAETITTALACATSLKQLITSWREKFPLTEQVLLEKYYKDDLLLYPPTTIRVCCEILLRRSRE